MTITEHYFTRNQELLAIHFPNIIKTFQLLMHQESHSSLWRVNGSWRRGLSSYTVKWKVTPRLTSHPTGTTLSRCWPGLSPVNGLEPVGLNSDTCMWDT